jgi:hypothetical protein
MSGEEREKRREEAPPAPLSRRQFLGGVGGAAVALTVGTASAGELPRLAEDAALSEAARRSPEMAKAAARREAAYQIRYQAAKAHRKAPLVLHTANGDEDRYPNRIGNYSKGLPHNSFGEVDPDAYASLLQAAGSGDPKDYAAIRTSGGRRLTNPMGGLAFDMEGVDAWDLTAPPAPALASAEEAGEGVELYWMALLRDVNFLDYADHPDVAAAAADLNAVSDFKGPRVDGKVTAQSLFRDPLPGSLEGPYVSQFLWLPTPFGAEYIDRRIQTALPGGDHLTRYSDWLDTQNGFGSVFSPPDPTRRHIRNGRDLSEWVHNDVLFQAYFIACLILGSPTNVFDAETDGGIGAPFNPGNPYLSSVRNQAGFVCWGTPHVKTLLCEVATRALKVAWHQKWQVHRRLRPEEFGGVVHHQATASRYPGVLHRDILESKALSRVLSKNGTGLLPMAFPEGSPTHPSYTAGHATVAGACVTVLKWFFDERFVISQPVVPTPDGLALQPYQGPPLTVGGELNKLASNIAPARNIAGVHWRSDANASLRLGEALAISILRDQRALFPEPGSGSTFTRFDGTQITI